jgi:hypothetical protein
MQLLCEIDFHIGSSLHSYYIPLNPGVGGTRADYMESRLG